MSGALQFDRGGTRLSAVDFGGEGRAVLLLHGLAGYAGEWTQTASWLTGDAHVVALDARGHGDSERFPSDVSRAAHVADAAFAVEHLQLGRVVVVGQSLGGVTGLLLAAEHPELVQGLVIVDAGPHGGDGDAELGGGEVEAALRRWPTPFATHEDAVAYFGGPSLIGQAWADGLEQRGDGWWPRFDVGVMTRTLADSASRSYWDAWERVECDCLIVRAGEGSLPPEVADAMIARGHHATLVEVDGAKHDVHLDRPAQWRRALIAFLDSCGA